MLIRENSGMKKYINIAAIDRDQRYVCGIPLKIQYVW